MKVGTFISLGVLAILLILIISFGMQSMVAIDTNPELPNSTYYDYYNETTDVFKVTFTLLDYAPMLVVIAMLIGSLLYLRGKF